MCEIKENECVVNEERHLTPMEQAKIVQNTLETDIKILRDDLQAAREKYDAEVYKVKAIRDVLYDTTCELNCAKEEISWLRRRLQTMSEQLDNIYTVTLDENLKAQGLRKRVQEILNQ